MSDPTSTTRAKIPASTLILAALAAAIGGALFAGSISHIHAEQAPVQIESLRAVQYLPRGTVDHPYAHLQVLHTWHELSNKFVNSEQAVEVISLQYLRAHPELDQLVVRIAAPNHRVIEYAVCRSRNGVQVNYADLRQYQIDPSLGADE